MSVRWTGELVEQGTTLFRIGRDGDQLVAEWVGLCELRSDRRGAHVSLTGVVGADERLLTKVRAGLGAALVAHLQGATSLHASAVAAADGARAFAFLGRSGAGKSTLAAWMCRRRGYTLVSDDVVRLSIDGASTEIIPGERDHWLDLEAWYAVEPDERGTENEPGKAPVPASRVAERPAKLTALVALSYGDTTEIGFERLRGHRAMEAILPCLVRFVLDEPDAQLEELRRIEAILGGTPLFALRAPRDLAMLPAVVDALENLK
ncbi:MAG: hypothetical protein JST00_27640 [Deltaproteobacteria bacterium]|nr:hypothetical protein [Deltaproteobacteria bacterium]